MRPACVMAPYCMYAHLCGSGDTCLFLEDLDEMEKQEEYDRKKQNLLDCQFLEVTINEGDNE